MRAANLFDQIIVTIAAANPSEQPLFDLETRIALTQDVFKDKPFTSQPKVSGLMVDFAKEKNADVVLRGLRASCDFDFGEMPLAQVNQHLHPTVETLFFWCLLPIRALFLLPLCVILPNIKVRLLVTKMPESIEKTLRKKFT